MRIIGDTKDYYDCIQANDQDRSLLYIRKEEELKLKNWPFPITFGKTKNLLEVDRIIVGFCGKIYPVFNLFCHDPIKSCTTNKWAYTVADVDQFAQENLKKKEYKVFSENSPRKRYLYRQTPLVSLHDFVKNINENTDKCKEMFEEKRSPIFIVRDTGSWYSHNMSITWDANLKAIEFYRLFDPQTAYQEISMFLGNIAWPDKPIPEISNDDLAASKGHGDPYSFRKMPQDK